MVTRNKIFNHDIMTCTHDAVLGNYLYSGRVLGMTNPEDIIQLHPDLEPEWSAIADHYARIGLSHSAHVVWDVALKILVDCPDYAPPVFFFGDATHETSPDKDWFRQLDENWFSVVEFINSKNNFIHLTEELDVSVPKTLCFENKANLKDTTHLPYPCYLKPAVSVDGVGIQRCQDEAHLVHALETLGPDIPLQLQEEITATSFLNLQYCVTVQGAERLAASEQVLDGFSHMGNRYPTVHQPWEIVEPMAIWMVEHGMKGLFAFDVAVVEDTSGPRYLAIECNPRFNGASYPTGIAHKLGIKSWVSQNFNTSCRSLKDLDLSGLEFDPNKSVGVILVNWGSILVGRIGVLLAGPIETQNELKAALNQRL